MKRGLIFGICFLFVVLMLSFVSAATKQYITNDASCSSTGLFSFGILNGDIHGGHEVFIGSNSVSTFVNGYVQRAQSLSGSSSPIMCVRYNAIDLWSDEQATSGDCSDSNVCRSWGVLVGGYLYAGSDAVSSQGILIGAYSSSYEDVTAYGSSVVCKLWDDDDSSSYDSYRSSNNFKVLSAYGDNNCITATYVYGSVSDRSGEDDNICPSTYGTSHCVSKSWNFGANSLDPGVYIMAMGIRTAAPYNRRDHANSHLFPAGNFPTPNTFYKSPPYKDSAPFYIISNRMLKASEIQSYFPKSEIENNFCEAAGYDKHPTTGVCCGNDVNDVGLIDSSYYCDGSSWQPLKGDGETCVEGYECTNSYCCAEKCSDIKCPDCGDGTKDAGEECDDGNQDNTDDCTNKCENAECGDGYVWLGNEECDDGNSVDTDDCTNACKDNICGDGFLNIGVEECDDGASNSDDNLDACRTNCKNSFCGDDVCDSDETCALCHHDCGRCTPWEDHDTCKDCVGKGFNWCTDLKKCVSSPSDETGCENNVDNADDCPPACVASVFNNYDHEIPTNYKARFKEIMSYKCERTFSFIPKDAGYLLFSNKQFEIANRNIIEILDITSNLPNEAALLTLAIKKDELLFSNDAFFYVWNDSSISWEELEYLIVDVPDTTNYFYQIVPLHFSLFLIAEIDYDYCGNGVFDEGYEACDGSVEGVTNCTACVCDADFEANESGFCLEDITGTKCSPKGVEKCIGYSLHECGSDLKWDNKGKVIGNCSVECYPIGNMSCQGEIPLRCGSDYQWSLQSRISGLCGYISTPLNYTPPGDRCGNGYCNYDEDEYSCPEDCAEEDDAEGPNWFLIALVVGIVILILVIVIVLFKIFSKERRGMPPVNRRLPPEHRPGPKREPGRPLEHNQPVGRPAVGQGSYPKRRYPAR